MIWRTIMKQILIFALVLLLFAGCTVPVETAAPTEQATVQIRPAETETVPVQAFLPATEVPTEPPEPADSDLVRVADYLPDIRQNLLYATQENFTGQRIYDFADAYLRYGTVKKLKAAYEELAGQNLGILIWDGFRPLAAQEKLWEICPDPAYVSHPLTGSRSHCRGSAIDLTLVDLKSGRELTMPTGFDDFSALADRDYSDCAPEAAANAQLLEEVMIRCGFKPYGAEWWHFSDTEDYPVEENFRPEQTVFDGGVG